MNAYFVDHPEMVLGEWKTAVSYTHLDVYKRQIKGNIAIIQHTDDGETQIETPEEGAVFEVYLLSLIHI